MTTFYFVRHALTEHTGKRLSGWLPGVHLSDEGADQARGVAETLKDVPFAAVYSSPIDRTVETARLIAAKHGLQPKIRKELGEVRYGRWTDRPFKSLVRTKLWTTVQRWPSGARFPDGETLREVQDRAVDAVERLRGEHPKKTVCCVSHADVIKLITAHYLGVHIDLFQRIAISPVSITIIGVSSQGPYVMAVNAPGLPAGRTA